MKEQILELLEVRRGKYVSGREIAEQLGITRSAVWKSVKQLERSGYQIEGVTNKGYRLKLSNEPISIQSIRSHLKTEIFGRKIKIFEYLDSTNRYLKSFVGNGEEGFTVIAEGQSHGQGRRGRHFFSPSNQGVYFSFLLRYPPSPFLVIAATALTVTETILAKTGSCPQIKWANDILLHGKKVCGILNEASVEVESGILTSMIVGIGLNVFTAPQEFPEELRPLATSLFLGERGNLICTRSELIAELLNRFEKRYRDLKESSSVSDLLNEYRRYSCILGEEVEITYGNGGCASLQGRVLDIDDQLQLIVEDKKGKTFRFSSGEVSLKRENVGGNNG